MEKWSVKMENKLKTMSLRRLLKHPPMRTFYTVNATGALRFASTSDAPYRGARVVSHEKGTILSHGYANRTTKNLVLYQ